LPLPPFTSLSRRERRRGVGCRDAMRTEKHKHLRRPFFPFLDIRPADNCTWELVNPRFLSFFFFFPGHFPLFCGCVPEEEERKSGSDPRPPPFSPFFSRALERRSQSQDRAGWMEQPVLLGDAFLPPLFFFQPPSFCA